MTRFIAILLLLAAPVRAEMPDLRHYPAQAACAPILILSHGFGGNANGLTDLAQATSAAGFDTWVMGHDLSGRAQLAAVLTAPDRRAALAEAVGDPAANAERAADVAAALAHALGSAGCDVPLRVLGGHSMGAQTTIVEAGAQNTLGVTGSDRFDAYVALSPQGIGARFAQGAWAGIGKPVLMVTGTQDRALEGDWTTRLAGFEGLPADGTKWLAVIDGANHRQVSGRGAGTKPALVRRVVVEFLTALRSGQGAVREMAGVDLRRR